MVIVVWGVSGCGKSTVGRILADRLDWPFFDADDFHPESNKDKMRRGIPLDDADRIPWLNDLAELIRRTNDAGQGGVLACSALKASYRFQLGMDRDDVTGVHLSGSKALVRSRLEARHHDYMPEKLLDSQFDTLELSSEGLAFDVSQSPDELCDGIIGHFSGSFPVKGRCF